MSGDVLLARDSVTRFFAPGFFHESSSPELLKIALGQFKIFGKIRGDIRKSSYTIGLNDTINFPMVPLV
jgi:hypothetical protein